MIRVLTYLAAGVILGGIIHFSIILTMPHVTKNSAWLLVTQKTDANNVVVMSKPSDKLFKRLQLDPALAHAICPLDLSNGPISFFGDLPEGFWTAAIIARDGHVPYSTTSRTNGNRRLNLAVFNAEQSRQLSAGDYQLEPGASIVKVDADQLLAIVRVLPPHRPQAPAFAQQLAKLNCAPV